MASPHYPPPAFAFSVAIAAGNSAVAQSGGDAAFQEVTGIDPKVDVDDVREGGVNSVVHRLPGVTTHGNLVLKRGVVTRGSALADWAGQTLGASLGTQIQPRTIVVCLLGQGGGALVTWTFTSAWPVKWEVGALGAEGSDILTETLEFAFSTVTHELIAAG